MNPKGYPQDSGGPKLIRCLLISAASLLLLQSLICSASPQQDPDIQRQKEKEREIRQRIQRSRQQLALTLRKEKEILAALDRLDRQLAEATKRRSQLSQKAEKLGLDIQRLNRELQELNSGLKDLRERFSQRMVALYKAQKTSIILYLLSEDDLSGALRKFHSWRVILQKDVELIHQYSEDMERRRRLKERLLAYHRELVQASKELEKWEEEIQRQRQQRRATLRTIQREKDLQKRTLAEFEKAAERLQRLIKSLQEAARHKPSKKRQVMGFTAQKGRLPLPVNGKVTRGFGRQVHPLWKTFTLNNGVVFSAPLGEEVRAVYEGTVVFAGWLRGYGNVLIIDHGDGYFTLCGHLSQITKREGDLVEQGEVVGYVGATGSMEGPTLYFEIRKGGRALDPSPWFGTQKGARMSR